MNFIKFLKYEKSYIYIYLIIFLVSAAVFLFEGGGRGNAGTFIYAFSLCTIIFIGFLLYKYQKNLKAIRSMDNESHEVLSLEAEYYVNQIESMRTQHIKEINSIQQQQKEHYDFIISWFHEIKTPIAVLRLIQQTEMNKNDVEEEVMKIENYVDQALYYAKLDSFHQDYDIAQCETISIVKSVVKDHSKMFISKKIRINIESESLMVQSDSKWLEFIINQLLTNSLKYTGRDGVISVRGEEVQDEKRLIIRDNGIGISQRNIQQIFNRGFTGETGRTHAKSTGMGLYLAQQLSNKLGHYISCTSDQGEYTEFTIHFPQDYDPYILMNKNNEGISRK